MVPTPVAWQAWCLHFDILVDRGSIKGLLGAQERILWGAGGCGLRFCTILGALRFPILTAFRVHWTKKVYFVMLVSRLLFLVVFETESGCLQLEKHGFDIRSIAKTNCYRSLNSHDLVRAARKYPSTLARPCRIAQRSVVSLLPPALHYAGAKRRRGGQGGASCRHKAPSAPLRRKILPTSSLLTDPFISNPQLPIFSNQFDLRLLYYVICSLDLLS